MIGITPFYPHTKRGPIVPPIGNAVRQTPMPKDRARDCMLLSTARSKRGKRQGFKKTAIMCADIMPNLLFVSCTFTV